MLTTHLSRSPDGELVYENIRLADVARHFGTPCYVYSRATIVENFRAYQAAFAASKPMICYAVKRIQLERGLVGLEARDSTLFPAVAARYRGGR